MDIRIRVLVEVSHRVQHLARLLCRSRGIEVCDGLPVDELVEHREVGAQAFRVELRMCGYGHDRIVPLTYRLAPGSSIEVDTAVRGGTLGREALPAHRRRDPVEDLAQLLESYALRDLHEALGSAKQSRK